MVIPRVGGSKPGAVDDTGLLVLGSDPVVEPLTYVGSSETSTSESRYDSERFSDDGFDDLDQLQFLRLEGVDHYQRRIVRIVGKFLPARVVNVERLKEYVTSKLVNDVEHGQFCVVYFHTTVERGENSPGMLTFRRMYEDLPQALRQRLETIYVVHPGLRSRLLLATVGRFFLSEGFYFKVKYVSRVEFLWDHMNKGQVEVPEFVQEHDEELENMPLMDYGFEADPQGFVDGPGFGAVSRLSAMSFN